MVARDTIDRGREKDLRSFVTPAECDALKAATAAAGDELTKLRKDHAALALEKEADARSMVSEARHAAACCRVVMCTWPMPADRRPGVVCCVDARGAMMQGWGVDERTALFEGRHLRLALASMLLCFFRPADRLQVEVDAVSRSEAGDTLTARVFLRCLARCTGGARVRASRRARLCQKTGIDSRNRGERAGEDAQDQGRFRGASAARGGLHERSLEQGFQGKRDCQKGPARSAESLRGDDSQPSRRPLEAMMQHSCLPCWPGGEGLAGSEPRW